MRAIRRSVPGCDGILDRDGGHGGRRRHPDPANRGPALHPRPPAWHRRPRMAATRRNGCTAGAGAPHSRQTADCDPHRNRCLRPSGCRTLRRHELDQCSAGRGWMGLALPASFPITRAGGGRTRGAHAPGRHLAGSASHAALELAAAIGTPPINHSSAASRSRRARSAGSISAMGRVRYPQAPIGRF